MTNGRSHTAPTAATLPGSSMRPNGVAAALPAPRPIPPVPSRMPTVASTGAGTNRADCPPTPGTLSPTGTTQEARHRGWYWHWNTLITQYAPILGLKGVGLLNSYTVWTDRREGSPHHGFAFPAQESEARFYGEGREELITLNKVLVALDLIEIHKEMVVRQDERGRRWRVPHNFYRVKDPKEGLLLSLPAVVRLLELAQRDRNVFRHIRHIFGPQFAPIDRTSLWHSLLPELRALPLWAELEARAARERRAPRAAAASLGTASALASPPESGKQRPKESTIVIPDDNDHTHPPLATDNAVTKSTPPLPTIAVPKDIAPSSGITAAHPGVVENPRKPGVDANTDVSNGRHTARIARPISEPLRPMIGSTDDEGMMSIEEGGRRFVVPADSMYYQSGETKEETTDTSRTSSRVRAHTHEGDTAWHSPPAPLPDPLPPARLAVSDLFAAMEAHRIDEPTDASDSPLLPGDWDQPIATVLNRALPRTTGDAALADVPEAVLGQPLPPEPGDPEEGLIVVRAVVVSDGPPIGTDERALLAEIESALAMTNSRPPSDMEMSLYWQIARDCDTAARTQPGPGSGLGWVLAAITEAVYSSGTGRVAPKYVARICERWTTDGYMSDSRAAPAPGLPAPPPQWPLTGAASATPEHAAVADADEAPATPAALPPDPVRSETERARLWPGVIQRLEGILPADALHSRWFTEARVLSVSGERATVEAIDTETALKLTNYRGLISRRLSDLIGRSVSVVFQAAPMHPTDPANAAASEAALAPGVSDRTGEVPLSPSPAPERSQTASAGEGTASPASPLASPWSWPASGGAPSPQTLPAEVAPRTTTGSGPMPVVRSLTQSAVLPDAAPTAPEPAPPTTPPSLSLISSRVPTFVVTGGDETNRDLWPRVLARLREGMNDVTFKVWIEPTALIATDADGTLVIGTRNRVQRERLERQHATEIAAALGALLDRTVRVRIAVIGE